MTAISEHPNLKPWKPGRSGIRMVGQLGRGNALHGREATRSLLRYLCAAITERRAGDGRIVPARHWATLRQVLFDMPRTMSDLSPQ
jgi:hypothetical protein